MALFPETVFISYPLSVKETWKTLITDFETGKEQRRRKWAFPKRQVGGINYQRIDPADFKDIWAFYNARKGAYESFYFYVPEPDYWFGEFIGEGDDAEDTFDLCSKSTDEESVVVYVDGVSSSFDFIEGGGQEGSDRAQLAVVPDVGAIITADFYGKLRLKTRFGVDNLSKEYFDYLMINSEIPLIEVRS